MRQLSTARERLFSLDLSWREQSPHSDARARLPGAPHAQAVSAMAGISSSAAGAAPLSPPPEPSAEAGHGGGGPADDKRFLHWSTCSRGFPSSLSRCYGTWKLEPIDRNFLAQAGGACRAAVAASGLPRAGTREDVLGKSVWVVRHRLVESSVERLAWAKASGCPWDEQTCQLAANTGRWRRCSGRGSTIVRGTRIRDQIRESIMILLTIWV